MRGGSSLKAVLVSTMLASATQVGCGPAVEGGDTEVEGVDSELGLEPFALEETSLDAEDLDPEDLLQPMGGRDHDQGHGQRVLICHFRGRDDDRDHRDGVVIRVSRENAHRHIRRHDDCRIDRDHERPGDRCGRRDCDHRDGGDHDGWDHDGRDHDSRDHDSRDHDGRDHDSRDHDGRR